MIAILTLRHNCKICIWKDRRNNLAIPGSYHFAIHFSEEIIVLDKHTKTKYHILCEGVDNSLAIHNSLFKDENAIFIRFTIGNSSQMCYTANGLYLQEVYDDAAPSVLLSIDSVAVHDLLIDICGKRSSTGDSRFL